MSAIYFQIKNATKDASYLIGAHSKDTITIKHELAHALYYTNKLYKKQMDKYSTAIEEKVPNLTSYIKRHYNQSVFYDEMQAYLASEDSFDGLNINHFNLLILMI